MASTSACDLQIEEGGGNTALLLKRISASLWQNGASIAVFVGLAVLLGIAILYVLHGAVKGYLQWKTQSDDIAATRGIPDAATASATNAGGEGSIFSLAAPRYPDDEVRPDASAMGADGLDVELPAPSSVTLLKQRMQRVQNKYDAYNKALGKALQARGITHDQDIIDKRIWANDGQDDWNWSANAKA